MLQGRDRAGRASQIFLETWELSKQGASEAGNDFVSISILKGQMGGLEKGACSVAATGKDSREKQKEAELRSCRPLHSLLLSSGLPRL